MRKIQIIVLDQSVPRVFITDVTYRNEGDLETDVDNRLRVLGTKLSQCSWMEVEDDFTTEDITIE